MKGLEFANAPIVWIFAATIVALVNFQAFKFFIKRRSCRLLF